MDQLIAFDRYLFERINLDWTNGVFDWLFPAITDLHKSPEFLIAVLPLLALWAYKGKTNAMKWMIVLLMAIGIADAFSYRVLKASTMRARPEAAGVRLQLRTHQHSGSSFPSNHTSNVFAAATVLTGAFPVGAPLWFGVAAAVGYSRIYVGVHFPLDVLGGALLGVAIGTILLRIFRRWLGIKSGGGSSRARNSNPSS
ncbi:MAG: phosphatase PAP2 family protein [Bdellovibrionota bacterium]